jgi:hypothetical protein
VLIVLLIAAFVGLVRLRRWIKEEDDGVGGSAGFGISDLRRLHREGKLSDEEFEKARGQMIAGAKAMTENLPDPLARPDRPADRTPHRPQGRAPRQPPDHPRPPGPADDDV